MSSRLRSVFNKVLAKSAGLFTDDPLQNYNESGAISSNPIINDAAWGALLNAPLAAAFTTKPVLDQIRYMDKTLARPEAIKNLTDAEVLRTVAGWPEEVRADFLRRSKLNNLNRLSAYLQTRRPPTPTSAKALAVALPILAGAGVGAGLNVGIGAGMRGIQGAIYDDSFLARLADSLFY